MTRRELSNLFYLKKEIEQEKRRLAELEASAGIGAKNITGIPMGKYISDKTGTFGSEIADLRQTLDDNLKKCICEVRRLTEFIGTIDDSQMRLIFTLRYIEGLSWRQVAYRIGGGNTSDSVRKAHNRFLEKWGDRPFCPDTGRYYESIEN